MLDVVIDITNTNAITTIINIRSPPSSLSKRSRLWHCKNGHLMDKDYGLWIMATWWTRPTLLPISSSSSSPSRLHRWPNSDKGLTNSRFSTRWRFAFLRRQSFHFLTFPLPQASVVVVEAFSASNPEEGSSFPSGSTGRPFQRLVPQTLLKTWAILPLNSWRRKHMMKFREI